MGDSTRLRLPPVPANPSLVSATVGSSAHGNADVNRAVTSNLLSLSPNFNVNRYVTKKTITQGMLDVALLMSNASQLKALLEVGSFYRYYTFMMVLVIASITLQLAVGVLLLWLSITNINKEKNQVQLDRINDAASVGVFFITIINIFSGVFGIEATKTHVL